MFEDIRTTYSGWNLDLPNVTYCGRFFNDSRVMNYISYDENHIYQYRSYYTASTTFTQDRYFEWTHTYRTKFEYSSCNKKLRALIKLKDLDAFCISSMSETMDVAWNSEINQERYRMAIQEYLNCSKA